MTYCNNVKRMFDRVYTHTAVVPKCKQFVFSF